MLIAAFDKRYAWRFFSGPGAESGAVQSFEIVPETVVPEPAVVKTMLIAGAGIGRLPDFHAADALGDGSLVRVLPHLEGDFVDAHALYPSHRSLSAKVRVFIDALVEHLASRERPEADDVRRPPSTQRAAAVEMRQPKR